MKYIGGIIGVLVFLVIYYFIGVARQSKKFMKLQRFCERDPDRFKRILIDEGCWEISTNSIAPSDSRKWYKFIPYPGFGQIYMWIRYTGEVYPDETAATNALVARIESKWQSKGMAKMVSPYQVQASPQVKSYDLDLDTLPIVGSTVSYTSGVPFYNGKMFHLEKKFTVIRHLSDNLMLIEEYPGYVCMNLADYIKIKKTLIQFPTGSGRIPSLSHPAYSALPEFPELTTVVEFYDEDNIAHDFLIVERRDDMIVVEDEFEKEYEIAKDKWIEDIQKYHFVFKSQSDIVNETKNLVELIDREELSLF